MRETYFTIKTDGENKIELKKSQFICSLKRIKTENEAKEFIAHKKKEHWKASHHCSAYVIDNGEVMQRSSDDGEPSGTAGIPMLEVLKKLEVINVVAVVTRYFGGTKLGTGGLIRAYSQAVSQAIQHIGIVEGKLQQEMTLTISYANLGKLEHFFEHHSYVVKEIIYAAEVELVCFIDQEKLDLFKLAVTNLLSGAVTFKKGGCLYQEVPLLKQ